MDANRRSTTAGFEGKSFYFDLENSPLIARQLTKYITELGGEIKGFLDQRIKYIITNRPKDQWPPKAVTSDKSRSSLPAFEPIKDQIIQSPINLNKNSSFSRGKLLLSAIAKSQQSLTKPSLPTDVLERGRYWNITILKAVDVLEFCRRHLSPVALDNSAKSQAKITRLKGAFIKLEDSRLLHRPAYKEFTEWPQINFEYQELMCPFLKKKVQKDTTNETVESLEGLAVKNRLKCEKQLDINAKNTTNNNNKKTVIKGKQKSSPNNQFIVKKNLVKKRRIPAFCEICGTDYENLIEHLKTETHETYTQNEENYKELKGVIQSLHPFNETNNTVKRIQFDAGSDSCDDSDDEQPISSPFQSTPNMSTIQLCGSKHKSHFLSIHDLIGNKSPPPLEEVPEKEHSECDPAEGQSSKTDLVLIPPSVTSPDEKAVHRLNQVLNSYSDLSIHNSDHSLDSKAVMNCVSEEL